MIYFDFGPYQSDKVLVGNKDSNRAFPIGNRVLIAGKDEARARSVAERSIGQYATNGYFSYDHQPIATWTKPFDRGFENPIEEFILIMDDVQILLGTINLDGFSIELDAGGLIDRFWVETSEDVKRRILASKLEDGKDFQTLPANFKFTRLWLAKLITDQY